MITDEDIRAHGYIWGTSYGCVSYKRGGVEILDEIIYLPVSQLEFSKNKNCVFYVWGWPGPDYNRYDYSDYGVTWAFTAKELAPHPVSEYDIEYVEKS